MITAHGIKCYANSQNVIARCGKLFYVRRLTAETGIPDELFLVVLTFNDLAATVITIGTDVMPPMSFPR